MSCFFTDQTFVCKMNNEFYEFDDKIIGEVNKLETPYFEQLFTGFITMTFALFLSSCIVANYVWKPMRKLDPNDLIEPEIPYCQRYYPIPDKNKENIDSLDNSYIFENIDKYGLVIMKYDVKTKSFYYWCDKEITYEYINTVVRKYVTVFGCKNIFIDRSEEMKKYTEEIKRKKEMKEMEKNDKDKDEEENEKDDSPFIKLKTRANKEKEKNDKEEDDEEWWKKKDSNIVIQNLNKVSYRGRISNLDIAKLKSVDKSETKPLTFADFRKMLSGK